MWPQKGLKLEVLLRSCILKGKADGNWMGSKILYVLGLERCQISEHQSVNGW